METETLARSFQEKVCAEVRLSSEGRDRYRVLTPFRFDDGDHLVIVLKQEAGRWLLTDEGHTYMHLSYSLDEADLQRGTRQTIITNALSTLGLDEVDGELVFRVDDDRFGDALYSYIQGLLRIADVKLLSRERVRSTFLEDFRLTMTELVPAERMQFDWHHPTLDPAAMYAATARVNRAPKPLFVFALQNDDHTNAATIALHQYERWALSFHSLAVFESQENINRRVLARFSDIGGKQISSLVPSNIGRIRAYIHDTVGLE